MMQRYRKSLWFVFTIISIFYCYEFFLRISPSIVVEQLLAQYHVQAPGIGAFSSSYFLGYLLMQIPAGYILDHYNFKNSIIISLLICVLGTLIFTVGDNLWVGLLGRFILGCGSAFAFIGVISFVKKYFPERDFSFLISLVISIGCIVGAIGQVFAVEIIHYLSWHFTIAGISIWGAILALAIGLVPNKNFVNTAELRCKTRFWQTFKKIVKNPYIWANGMIGSLLYLPTSIIVATWGVEFFYKHYQFTQEKSTIGITILFIGWAIGGPFFSLLNQYIHREKSILRICAILVSVVLFILILSSHLSVIAFYILLFLFGFLSSAQLLVWRIFSFLVSDKTLAGMAGSFTNLLIMLSIGLADLIVGQLVSISQHFLHNAQSFDAHDLQLALLLLPVLTLCTLFFIGLLPNCTKPKS